MTITKINRQNIKKRSLITLLLIPFIFTLIFLFPEGDLNGEKSKFTVISHDNTNFPLTGKHRTTPCSDCHINSVVKNTPTNCEACHWERKQDDRYKLQFGYHCEECHTPFAWKKLKPNAWNHSEKAGFHLEGIHKTIDCFNCHKSDIPGSIPGECISCHQEDYNETDGPDHKASGFPFDCTLCHSGMISWENARFSHGSFPMESTHKTLDCRECHTDGKYNGLSTDCFSCHLDDYNGTKDPNHKESGFSTICTDCHTNMSTWEGASVPHFGFPLQGAHKALDCTECHKGGNYTKLPSNCSSCHIDDYNNAENPNHKSAGYPTSCKSCHSGRHYSWDQAEFEHNFIISYGHHSKHDCNECHLTSNYNEFFCSNCHIKSKTDNKHSDVNGYIYNNQACYSCHPTGFED